MHVINQSVILIVNIQIQCRRDIIRYSSINTDDRYKTTKLGEISSLELRKSLTERFTNFNSYLIFLIV